MDIEKALESLAKNRVLQLHQSLNGEWSVTCGTIEGRGGSLAIALAGFAKERRLELERRLGSLNKESATVREVIRVMDEVMHGE